LLGRRLFLALTILDVFCNHRVVRPEASKIESLMGFGSLEDFLLSIGLGLQPTFRGGGGQ